jgi:hypothetical protein
MSIQNWDDTGVGSVITRKSRNVIQTHLTCVVMGVLQEGRFLPENSWL